MWAMVTFGTLAAIAGVLVINLAYWVFVVAPQFEAFRREMETARGEWATYILGQAPVQIDPPDVTALQSKRHAATSESEEAA